MRLHLPPTIDPEQPCPYLPGRASRTEFFLATELEPEECDELLNRGWRKFGPQIFRPACAECRLCTPLRLEVKDFKMSKSQRRVAQKNGGTRVIFKEAEESDEFYQLHARFNRERYGREISREEYQRSFHWHSGRLLQSEFRRDGKLMAAGFLDLGRDCLSSVYFFFDPDFAEFSPGVFGALAELRFAAERGCRWYHLGYLVPGCSAMEYKARFQPHELMDWKSGKWATRDTTPP